MAMPKGEHLTQNVYKLDTAAMTSDRSPAHDQYGRYSFTYPNITAVLATLCMLHKQMESIIKLLQLSVYFFNLFLQSFISLLQTLKAFPPDEKRTETNGFQLD